MNMPEYRLAKQNSYCRVCDKINRKGIDTVFYVYSLRNRGQNILICKGCVEKMYFMVNSIEED